MSTTTELLTAKAELQRVTAELAALRAGVEALLSRAADRRATNDDGMVVHTGGYSHTPVLQCDLCPSFPHVSCASTTDLRTLLTSDADQ